MLETYYFAVTVLNNLVAELRIRETPPFKVKDKIHAQPREQYSFQDFSTQLILWSFNINNLMKWKSRI